MNFNNVNLVKLGNDSEVNLIKLDKNIIYSNLKPGGIYNSYRIRVGSYINNTISIVKKECYTDYNLITDWGDGTIDNKSTHTYAGSSIYTIVTTGFLDKMTKYEQSGGLIVANVSNVYYLRPDIIDGSCLFYGFTTPDENLYLPETSHMTDMSYMFYNCKNLEDTTVEEMIDLNSFNTSNVTNMNHMFYGCNNICDLEINNWDTSKVTDMSYMFYDCFDKYATYLDLSNWDTSNVTNMDSMFSSCNNLNSLNISNFDLTKVTNTDNMLAGSLLGSFSKLRLDNCSRNTIEKIITSEGFPTSDYGTHEIYVKSSRINNLTPPEGWVFVYVSDTEEPDVPVDPNPEEPDIPLYIEGEFEDNTNITEVRTMVDNTHTSLSYMFAGCTALTTVNTEDWDTSNVKSMYQMFINCDSLTSIDVSSWDVSRVTNTSYMFCDCGSLTSIDLSSWDTRKDIDMQSMFYNCESLDYLNLSNLDASQAKVSLMFFGCNNLHTLRLDNCNADTIYNIIKKSSLPTTLVNGKKRKIYFKKENRPSLSTGEPVNWEIIYVN